MKLTYDQISYVRGQAIELLKRDDLNGRLIVKIRSAIHRCEDALKPILEMIEDWQKIIQDDRGVETDVVVKEQVKKELENQANQEIGSAAKQQTEIEFDQIKIDDLVDGRHLTGALAMDLMELGLLVD